MISLKNKFLLTVVVLATVFTTGCKKSKFAEINTNPEVLYDVPPENQFLNATISAHNADFEWYYDLYRRIMPWMQLSTGTQGNGKAFIEDAGNFNQRYGNYYVNVGNRLYDIRRLIENMPEEEQARRVYMKAIPNVLFAHYTFYVSDINGSIPYYEAFQGRYGGTLTPKYDSQERIFTSLDSLLKATIATLKTTQAYPQLTLGTYDLYYGGDVIKWIKAANALRLRIAMRWMKRDPNRMKTIAMEVLSSPATDLMSSIDDSWVLDAASVFSSGGNWSPGGFRAPKPTVDFMLAKTDPRIRFFFQKNAFGQYVGSYTNPDAADPARNPAAARLYTTTDTLSDIMPRLFTPSSNGGTGVGHFPIITYADFAFMRAELAARGVTTENAETWYNAGVTASIRLYDKWANAARVQERNSAQTATSYVAVTDAEIANYLQQPGVKYDMAKGIELIAVQAYINFFKNPNEAWALYKRTGLPNHTSVLPLERLYSDAIEQFVPRRAPIPFALPTDLNYANNQAAIAEMAKDPDFGAGPSDVTGRVWWDDK